MHRRPRPSHRRSIARLLLCAIFLVQTSAALAAPRPTPHPAASACAPQPCRAYLPLVTADAIFPPETPGADAEPPTPPANLRTTGQTATTVDLAWDAAADNVAVTGYELASGDTSIGATTATGATVTGLAPGASYTFTVRARDAAGNRSAPSPALIVTTADTQPPGAPANLRVLDRTDTTVTLAWDPAADNVAVADYQVYDGAALARTTGLTTTIVGGLAPSTNYTFEVAARDAAGNRSPHSAPVTARTASPDGLPEDPAAVATPIDPTVPSDLATDTAFLYTGEHPIQTGVLSTTIDPARVAVLRGRVQTRDGAPLPGVRLSVHQHPEFGSTLSRQDGVFDLVVNGGGVLTLDYARAGYLPAQRQISAPWRDYAWLPNVALVALDTNVTEVTLGANTLQVARGSRMSDADGARQSTLFFPTGVTATLVLSDGAELAAARLHVRSTEYTVGPNGPAAMPGALPPNSGYTYAVELSADEAQAAGATAVRFSTPVIHYVENFVGFPVGGIVPSGYYDRERAAWIASENGRVVKIVAIGGGLAELDTSGDGAADDASELGVSDAERRALAERYTVGQELWRVPIDHFTPWDHNWPYELPDDAVGPDGRPWGDNPLDDPCTRSGSKIECQNQILGEHEPIAGTPYSLHYQSDRAADRTTANSLAVPLSGENPPASLKRIKLEIAVAGRQLQRTFSQAQNQLTSFTWDGRDAYGRLLQGKQETAVRVGYVYQVLYLNPANFDEAFARSSSGAPITGDREAAEVTLWQTSYQTIASLKVIGQALGGWSLSVQHTYDVDQQTLYLGDGTRRSAQNANAVLETAVGDPSQGTGGPAITARLDEPARSVVAPDGSIYIADTGNNRVRRIGPDGIITTVAGNGATGYRGDGGPATAAQLYYPSGLDIGPDGSLYIADTYNHRVRRVAPDGIITTVAGTDPGGFSGDGGPAAAARLYYPKSIAVAANGVLYIADTGNNRVRRVGLDGTITTVAGNGQSRFGGDGGPATSAAFHGPTDVAIGPDGSLYIADIYNYRVRRVDPNGIITTVAGSGQVYPYAPGGSYGGDWGPATSALLNNPNGVAVGADGSIYIADTYNHRVRRVGPDGTIVTVAGGNGGGSFAGDYVSAIAARLNFPSDVALGLNGDYYIADRSNDRIRRVDDYGTISTVAGGLLYPAGVAAAPDGSIYTADTDNSRVLRTGPDGITRVFAGLSGVAGMWGDEGPAAEAGLNKPFGLALAPDGSLYIADRDNNSVRRVAPDGTITTVAGVGQLGFSGDEGPATSAELALPEAVAVSPDGRLYIADMYNNRIREVAPDGIITTVAGNGACGFSGDGGPASAAQLCAPRGVAIGPDGSIYIADSDNGRVRRIGQDGIISTVAGNGDWQFGGDGGPATEAALGRPIGLAVGADGTVYIADDSLYMNRVRAVGSDGVITTLAGTGACTYEIEHGAALAAPLCGPAGIALDPKGSLYIADMYTNRVRYITRVLPGFSRQDIAIPSSDGAQVYQFSPKGRHLRTLDALTGATLYSFTYDDDGRLTGVTDRDGLTTTIERSGDTPTAIVSPYGQRTTLSVSGGYLAAIADPTGATTRFGYTPGGLLTSLTDPRGGVHTFNYDTLGRLTSDTNPAGGYTAITRAEHNGDYTVRLTNALNDTTIESVESLPEGGQRTTSTGPSGAVATTLTRPDGSRQTTDPSGIETTVIEGPDPRWGMQAPFVTSVVMKTADGRIFYTQTASRAVTLADPLDQLSLQTQTDTVTTNGRTTTTVYDAVAHTITMTDPAGKRTVMALDSRGRTIRDETSNLAPKTYTYDDQGQLTSDTEGSGAGARTTTIAYNERGQPASSTDPSGATTTFTYDAAGHVLSQTLPSGQTLTFAYDAAGNRTSSTDAQGVRTAYEYDLQNRLTAAVLDPAGRAVRTEYHYDAANNLLERVDDAGAGRLNVTTRYAYTPIGSGAQYAVSTITDALGQQSHLTYNESGALVASTDPLGRTTTMAYTPEGWLAQVTTPAGRTTTTAYNGIGQPIRVTDPRGGTTTSTYDAIGRLKTVTAGTSDVDYQPALYLTTSYTYDVNGRVIRATDPSGHDTTNTYDAFGRLVRVADPLGNTATFAYDAMDRLVSRTAGANAPGESQRVDYAYDALGRVLTERVDPDGRNLLTQYRYARAGSGESWNLQEVVDPNGNLTAYHYNSLGLRDQTIDAQGQVWRFDYDNLGRLVRQTDPLGHATAYTLDALGRTASLTEGGRTQRWGYNADGTLASATDFAGRTTALAYDADGRLTGVDYPAGTDDAAYAYDMAGNLTSVTDGLGTTSYAYDVLNRMIERTRDGRTVSYGYNMSGQTAQIDYWGQGAVGYSYDAAGRLTDLMPWGAGATSYVYRGTGLLAQQIRDNGVTTAYGYDSAGRLTSLLHSSGTTARESIEYALDANGNRTQMVDGDGVTTYVYDSLNRLANVAYPAIPGGPGATSVPYTFDPAGNRLGDGTASFSYDASNRIADPSFSYDANGNLLNDGVTSYEYDAANRLVKTVKGGVTTTYGYDGNGNLIRETAGGVTTDFVLDERGGLPAILGEVRSDGAELRYAYGPSGVAAQQTISGTEQSISYPLLDGLGSVRQLTDASGAVTLSRSYDAFGNLRHSQGAGWTTLGFTGERENPLDGTVYLRARHYSPALGRFLQRDSYGGEGARPQSLNRYAYTENNPVNWTDPSGMCIGYLWGSATCRPIWETGQGLNIEDGKKYWWTVAKDAVGLIVAPVDLATGLLTHPVETLRGAARAPFETMHSLYLGIRCDDSELLAHGLVGTGAMVVGAAEGLERMNAPVEEPRLSAKTEVARENGTLAAEGEIASAEATASTSARTGGEVVASGHGGWTEGEYTTLTDGQEVTVYGEPGDLLTDELGNAIEYAVQTNSKEVLSGLYSRTYGPGEQVPNLVLYPTVGYGPPVRTARGTLTVETPTQLGTILDNTDGPVHLHWAACLACKTVSGIDRGVRWRNIPEDTAEAMSEWLYQNRP